MSSRKKKKKKGLRFVKFLVDAQESVILQPPRRRGLLAPHLQNQNPDVEKQQSKTAEMHLGGI